MRPNSIQLKRFPRYSRNKTNQISISRQELLNQRIWALDPFDANLSDADKKAIVEKARTSSYYFLLKCVKATSSAI